MSNLEVKSYDLSALKFAIVDDNNFYRKMFMPV